MKELDILWDGPKILRVLRKHPAITDDVVKQVLGILEHPVLVMQTQSKNAPNRLTIFGEVYDTQGDPVLAVLELLPQERATYLDGIQVVASAYGKDNELQSFIDSSPVLYVDPDMTRTQRWMERTGVQFPVGPTTSSPVGSIAYEQAGSNARIAFDAPMFGQLAENKNISSRTNGGLSGDVEPLTGTRPASAGDVPVGITPDSQHRLNRLQLPLGMAEGEEGLTQQPRGYDPLAQSSETPLSTASSDTIIPDVEADGKMYSLQDPGPSQEFLQVEQQDWEGLNDSGRMLTEVFRQAQGVHVADRTVNTLAQGLIRQLGSDAD